MTETTPIGSTTLKQFNLRESMLAEGTTLVSPAQVKRRRKKRITGSRIRRQTSLNMIPSITPALALDPITGELLLCNAETGDILRCNVGTGSCMMEVERNALDSVSPVRVGKL